MDKVDRYFIILVALVLFLCLLVFFKEFKLVEKSYSYEYVTLDNKNIIRYGVVDYMCSDGVKTSHYKYSYNGFFYASTWKDAKVHSGECFIKVRL